MKIKRISLSVLAFFLAMPLFASARPGVIVHLGLSGSPLVAGKYYTDGGTARSTYGTMSSIYEDYMGPITTTGTIIAGVDIKLNRVVAISVDLGVNTIFSENFSGVTNQKIGTSYGVAAYLFPKAKLYYFDRTLIRMYGTIGVGIGKYFGYPSSTSSSQLFKNPMKLEAQAVPFGIEVGKKVFGFAEIGVGTIFMGVHAGVGLKF